MVVNPRIVPKGPRIRKLKHLRRTTIRAQLRPRQLRIKQRRRPRSSIKPRPEILKLRLKRQIAIARRISIYVTRRQDQSIHISVSEDSAHSAVPGASESASVVDDGHGGAVGGCYGGANDVDAIF